MEKKNIKLSGKDISDIKKTLEILLKNPQKNFYQINSIYQTLLINYFYLKKTDFELY